MMLHKLRLLLLFTLISHQVASQTEVDKVDRAYLDKKNIYQGRSEDFRSIIGVSGSYEINSNAITNSFVKGILFKGNITEDLKNDVSAKIKRQNNRLGFDIDLGITGTHHLGALTLIGRLGFREHGDLRFSKDLFEVLLRGNKKYAGLTADLSPSKLNYFNYQNIYIGFAKELSAKPYIIGAGISLIKGGQVQRFQVDRASLFTEETGEYIELNTAFKADFNRQVDSYFSASGFGSALNLTLSRKFEKGILNTELRDIGFIYWSNTTSVEADTNIRYEGEEIENILDYKDYSYGSIDPDTLRQKFGIGKKTRSFASMLPLVVNINYTHYFSDKFNLSGGVKYIAFANYVPRAYVRGIFYVTPEFFVAPGIVAGGYGTVNSEVSLFKSFKDRFTVSATAIFLEYLIAPAKTQGFGGNISLIKIF